MISPVVLDLNLDISLNRSFSISNLIPQPTCIRFKINIGFDVAESAFGSREATKLNHNFDIRRATANALCVKIPHIVAEVSLSVVTLNFNPQHKQDQIVWPAFILFPAKRHQEFLNRDPLVKAYTERVEHLDLMLKREFGFLLL